ncbi:MAG: hypothetical protein QM778_37695 [Myxococcales bacterium]
MHPDSLRHAPALFQEPEASEPGKNARLLYAAVAFGTLLVYVGWLTLLEDF